MMRLKTGLALIAACGWASAANAVVIDFGAATGGSLPTTDLLGGHAPDSLPNNGSITPNQAVGQFSLSGSWAASSGSSNADFATQSIDATLTGASGGILTVLVTASNLQHLGPLSFASSFTTNAGLPTGWTVREQTWFSATGGVLAAGVGLGNTLLADTGNLGAGATVGPIPFNATALTPGYSFTEEYIITALPCVSGSGQCTSNSTIDVAVAAVGVPGPIVGAGLPGLIAACGGLLAFARHRRRQLV
jgi:hypothetical protein